MANWRAYLGDHTHNETLLLDVVRFYRLVILEDFACVVRSEAVAVDVSDHKEPR